MNARDRENFLSHIMQSGFEKATLSFSKFINRPVKMLNAHSSSIKQASDLSYLSEEHGEMYVLITNIIGHITGKSFLIFSREESEEIFKALKSTVSNQFLNESFLLEIDNIISASVISEISNSLDLEIYGDVPQLVKMNAWELQNLLVKEISKEESASMICSNATFQIDRKDQLHPQFLWKLSKKIFDSIREQQITV